jgi:hypothetical protein
VSEALLVCVVLALIYLLECVAWGPADARAFRARPRGVWTESTELFTLFADRWRACVGGILPGTGGVAWTESQRIALSPTDVCACGSAGRSSAPIAYEGISRIHADGRKVKARSHTLALAATSARARELAALVGELGRAQPAARAALIEADMARTLDSRRARRALRYYRWCVRGLVWPERVLAVSMFVLVPVALLRRGFIHTWPEAALTLALTIAVTIRYAARMHRLRKHASGVGPISDHVITMVLAPPAAIRADDVVSRDMFGGLSAITVARVAGSDALGRDVAAGTLRELRFPLEDERTACCEARAWNRAAWSRVFEAWLAREFGSIETLLAPPARETEAMQSHCPRCLSQYSRAGGECDACPGVVLASFEQFSQSSGA